jgi:hypothetical protein
MRNSGGLWEDRQTRDWFWIEKRGNGYFSSGWISCVEAVRILKGRRPIPQSHREVKDIGCFDPVPEGVIELLARAVDRLWEG